MLVLYPGSITAHGLLEGTLVWLPLTAGVLDRPPLLVAGTLAGTSGAATNVS
jgi:hypothetical protein